MKKLKFILLLILTAGLVYAAYNPQESDRILGVWEPGNGKARVKIEKIGEKYYGKIVWLREPNDPNTGQPKLDKNNPDEALRKVPLKGYRLLRDFTYIGKDTWEKGSIYDPENGSTYSCIIKMQDENTLDIRGYIGISAIGRTDVWKRLVKKTP